jgi:3-deoxy-D-manno-octulosonic-acid transferase
MQSWRHVHLEPAALRKPILIGPHTFNFAEITDTLIAEDAAVRVANGAKLGAEVVRILSDPKRAAAMGEAALAVVERERGAVPRTLAAIEEILDATPVRAA